MPRDANPTENNNSEELYVLNWSNSTGSYMPARLWHALRQVLDTLTESIRKIPWA